LTWPTRTPHDTLRAPPPLADGCVASQRPLERDGLRQRMQMIEMRSSSIAINSNCKHFFNTTISTNKKKTTTTTAQQNKTTRHLHNQMKAMCCECVIKLEAKLPAKKRLLFF
jgi:hypothetical protein